MINLFFQFAENSSNRWWIESLLACRALLFVGGKYKCPCCGWSLRAFTHGGSSLRVRRNGYCPRCNSKARHRRDWLYLQEHTNLFREPLRLLHVSPKYALSRRFTRMPNLDFVGVDLEGRPNVTHRVDITKIPFEAQTFDAAICIHVLEHIENDQQAIKELFRVLTSGGWALISVPINFEQQTYEDPTIVDPWERKRHFGEEQHVRTYGYDFAERLEACGFQVHLDRGENLDATMREKFGLLDDENVFHCRKP